MSPSPQGRFGDGLAPPSPPADRTRILVAQVMLKKPSIEFDAWEFSYPLFVSVITFGTLLSQLEGNVLNVANIVLSFQTGK